MALKRVNAYHGTVPGTCGVGYTNGLEYFHRRDSNEEWFFRPTRGVENRNPGGAGWLIAGFVDTPVCKDGYYRLCKKWGNPVFQSPIRRNVNSRNNFFFCIFDTKKKVV